MRCVHQASLLSHFATEFAFRDSAGHGRQNFQACNEGVRGTALAIKYLPNTIKHPHRKHTFGLLTSVAPQAVDIRDHNFTVTGSQG
jgi:hypothetical protein